MDFKDRLRAIPVKLLEQMIQHPVDVWLNPNTAVGRWDYDGKG